MCGRLLAALEEAQWEAVPGLETTLVDHYYMSASTAPRFVFPLLLRGARANLYRLRGSRRGAFNALEARLEEVLSLLDANESFPRALSLEQQGLFSLGFYHQRAHTRARVWTPSGGRSFAPAWVDAGDAAETREGRLP